MACIFITTNYNDQSLSHYYRSLAQSLTERGHRLVLIVPGQRHELVNHDTNPAIVTWPSARPTKWRDALFLRSLIRRYQADCIIGNFAALNLSMLVGALCGVTHRWAWYHTMSAQIDADHQMPAWRRIFQRLRQRPIFRLATALIANSTASSKDAQQVYGIPADKCHALHFLLPEPPVHNDGANAHSLICVGRLYPSKGQDTLIRALPHIRARAPKVTVEFIGVGPEKQRYQALAETLGVSDCCHFAGSLPRNAVLAKMAAAAVCVTASRNEALGLVCIEAQSVGTPVVVSAIDGLAELVVEGETGFKVPADQPAQFAERISTLLLDHDRRKSMGRRARQHFEENFSDRNFARHADWFEQLLNRPPAQPERTL